MEETMSDFHIKPGVADRLKWFQDSPDAGDPECICSWCGKVIEEDEMPLRLFRSDNREARIHLSCWNDVVVEQNHDVDAGCSDGNE
jgi:hypothetical protein